MMYIFGVKRHTSATVALRLMEIHRVVICTCKQKKHPPYKQLTYFWFEKIDDRNRGSATRRNAQGCELVIREKQPPLIINLKRRIQAPQWR